MTILRNDPNVIDNPEVDPAVKTRRARPRLLDALSLEKIHWPHPENNILTPKNQAAQPNYQFRPLHAIRSKPRKLMIYTISLKE